VNDSLLAAFRRGAVSARLTFARHPRVATLALAAAVVVLLALSIARTYALGQHARMYDNPVYRWRESLAIALSRMQTPPLHGYLAYRSVRDYLGAHGLALSADEGGPVPTPGERRALVTDGHRMDRLIRDAAHIPVDATREPVILKANELGLADFYYWAFRLFGLKVEALVPFYYSILLVSIILFFWTFRGSPFCLLVLMLYLAGHYFVIDYANQPFIQAVHSSRFFPVLALLPTLHLLLLLWRREPPTAINIAIAALQTAILMFVVFCRGQALWQALAVLASALVLVRYRDLWHALPRPVSWPGMLAALGRDTWPALVVVCGLAGLLVYVARAPDARFYRAESNTHIFWHTVYVGLISADRELARRYGYGEDRYSDGLSYLAALHDLRGRNETSAGVSEVVDGVITIDIWKDTAAFERVLRRLFFEVVAEHPWLTLRSFLAGKPRDQFAMLFGSHLEPSGRKPNIPPMWNARAYLEILGLAFGASLLALAAGAGLPCRKRAKDAALTLIPLAACSWITTLIMPSPLIVDVIVLYLMLALLVAAYLPLALAWDRLTAEKLDSRVKTP